MASTINEQLVISTPATVEQAEVSEGLRIARYRALRRIRTDDLLITKSVPTSLARHRR